MTNTAFIIAILMGLSIAFQPITNAAASRYIGLGSLMVVSNGIVFLGSIVYALLVRERAGWEEVAGLRPDLLFGGAIYGLLIVFGGIYVFPRMGATFALATIIMSQLFFGLVIDRYGLYGIVQQPISRIRIFGVVLMLIGVLLIQVKNVP